MSFERSSALEAQPTDMRREEDPEYRKLYTSRHHENTTNLIGDDPEFSRYAEDLSVKLFSLVCAIIYPSKTEQTPDNDR